MDKKKQKSMYNLIYRVRKACTTITINTRSRMIYYNHTDGNLMQERKINRLRKDFNFSAQSEIRE